jgi:hypothetical protein
VLIFCHAKINTFNQTMEVCMYVILGWRSAVTPYDYLVTQSQKLLRGARLPRILSGAKKEGKRSFVV